MAFILLLNIIKRTDTFRCGLLVILLEFLLKQLYDISSKIVRLDLDSNQERKIGYKLIKIIYEFHARRRIRYRMNQNLIPPPKWDRKNFFIRGIFQLVSPIISHRL
jgi:hypothetical protein